MDQDFFIQSCDFSRVVSQVFGVIIQALQLVQYHPSLDASSDRGAFVVGKINACGRFEQRKNSCQAISRFGRFLNCCQEKRANQKGTATVVCQFLGNFFRRQNKIDIPCSHSGIRHTIEFCRVLTLSKSHASNCFDCRESQ